MGPATEAEGYRAQAAAIERLVAQGRGPIAGWKVGVTTPQMRAALGIDAPIGGTLLAAGRVDDGATIRHAAYTRPGIECEIAFVLAAPLGGAGIVVDVATAGAAVGTVHPALEIVDDRYGGDYRAFGIPAIIADNSFHAGFVVGPAVDDWRALDLPALRGVTRANGAVTYEGYGRDVQGHPLASLAWMANHLGALGKRIEAGHVVLTGSLPVPYWANAGDVVEIEIERLGALTLNVA